MSVSLTSKFLSNARGFTLKDANGAVWAINANTNEITAAVAGAAGGTVTSVGLADGSTAPLYAISGSPVTVSGALTFTLNNQAANLVLAGPTTGAAAQPTFRALVLADIPTGYAYGNLSGAPSIPTGADPTAKVALAAVPGAAATFMRSDGAPALDVTITPTWTGQHTFTPTAGTGVTVNALAGGNIALALNGATSGADGRAVLRFTANLTTAQQWDLGVDTSGGTTKTFSLRNITGGGTPLSVSKNNNITVAAPISGDALTVSNLAGANALVVTGNSAGTAVIRLNTQATTGAQTATFSATNKPGTGTTAPTKWMPVNVDGTTMYFPLWL